MSLECCEGLTIALSTISTQRSLSLAVSLCVLWFTPFTTSPMKTYKREKQCVSDSLYVSVCWVTAGRDRPLAWPVCPVSWSLWSLSEWATEWPNRNTRNIKCSQLWSLSATAGREGSAAANDGSQSGQSWSLIALQRCRECHSFSLIYCFQFSSIKKFPQNMTLLIEDNLSNYLILKLAS